MVVEKVGFTGCTMALNDPVTRPLSLDSFLCVYMGVCMLYVYSTEILRHFFGYQTSERNCFAQKHNIDVSIEPNVQLMFILQN